jgi:hypothetical protein
LSATPPIAATGSQRKKRRSSTSRASALKNARRQSGAHAAARAKPAAAMRAPARAGVAIAREPNADGAQGKERAGRSGVEEQSGLNPSASGSEQWGIFHGKLLTYPETFFLGVGGSVAAHSTRAETITFSFANAELLNNEERARNSDNPNGVDCSKHMNGIQIESDLKLDQFIWDKATVAMSGNATSLVSPGGLKQNPFGTFQDQLTFVASFGGNLTPTWHIEQVILNPSPPFFSAMRTKTDTLIITFGPLKSAKPPVLADLAQQQHNAALIGAATAGVNKAYQ